MARALGWRPRGERRGRVRRCSGARARLASRSAPARWVCAARSEPVGVDARERRAVRGRAHGDGLVCAFVGVAVALPGGSRHGPGPRGWEDYAGLIALPAVGVGSEGPWTGHSREPSAELCSNDDHPQRRLLREPKALLEPRHPICLVCYAAGSSPQVSRVMRVPGRQRRGAARERSGTGEGWSMQSLLPLARKRRKRPRLAEYRLLVHWPLERSARSWLQTAQTHLAAIHQQGVGPEPVGHNGPSVSRPPAPHDTLWQRERTAPARGC